MRQKTIHYQLPNHKTTTKNLTKNAQHNAKIDPEPPQSTKIRTPRGEHPAKIRCALWRVFARRTGGYIKLRLIYTKSFAS